METVKSKGKISDGLYSIYEITNTNNSFVYIGCTSRSLADRWQQHVYSLSGIKKFALYMDMKQFGVDTFNINLVCSVKGRSRALKKEGELIKKLVSSGVTVYNRVKNNPEPIVSIKIFKKSRKSLNMVAAIENITCQDAFEKAVSMYLSKVNNIFP